MLVTVQKSVLSFYRISPGKTVVATGFYWSLTDKLLIQQAAHMLPLKSSFPIDLHTARLEGKRWEVLSTHLVETIPLKSNMGTQKSRHNEPLDLQPTQPPPTWREGREALELLSSRFIIYFTLKHILNTMQKYLFSHAEGVQNRTCYMISKILAKLSRQTSVISRCSRSAYTVHKSHRHYFFLL